MKGKKSQKPVRLNDNHTKMLEYLKNELDASENTVFKIALVKLYKEIKD